MRVNLSDRIKETVATETTGEMSGLMYCLISGREVKVKCLLLLLMNVRTIECASAFGGSISVKSAVLFQPVERHALLGQSFVNISGISAIRCSARCLRHHRCFSFNYDHISRVCQMNNVTRDQVPEKFQENKLFSYYDSTEKVNICKNTGCSSSEKSTSVICSKPNVTFECFNTAKLGLEDGSIPDDSLSASSNWTKQDGYDLASTPAGGRLNKVSPNDETIGAWHPRVADTNQWIQVDLDGPTYITGVLMQGRQDHCDQWVTKYKVQYQPPLQTSLCDVKDQLDQTQVFDGNTDNKEVVESQFDKPVVAVKVRIVPVEWNDFIALRFELLGCPFP